jgi:hypothetical protein
MLKEKDILIDNIKSFRIINEAVDGNVIEKAINDYEYLYIYYSGDKTIQKGYRVVKPFVYGTYKKGTKNNGAYVLRAWEESGNSDSFYGLNRKRRKDHEYFTDYLGTSPGWRVFFVDKITSILPTGKKFNLDKDGFPPFYKGENDKEINVVTCIPLNKQNTLSTDGLDSSTEPDEIEQNVDEPIFNSQKQSNKFYAFNAGAKQREIANDEIKKIYDRIKNVSKKNVRDYIIATNEDGDFVPLNKKYENIISRDSYVGNLYDLYNRMVNNAQPMGNDFFEKGKDNVINKNKI